MLRSQAWRANDFRFRGKLDWRYYRRTKTSELTPEEKDVQGQAVRKIDSETRDRFITYRKDSKYDAVSNDRLRQLAMIDAIKTFVDGEVYDEMQAVSGRVSLLGGVSQPCRCVKEGVCLCVCVCVCVCPCLNWLTLWSAERDR